MTRRTTRLMTRRTGGFVVAGLIVALVLAFGASRWASSEPDGLEKVAADQSLDAGEAPHAMADSPFADYSTRGVDDRGLSTGIAGIVGVVATFAVAGGLVWVAVRVGNRRAGAEPT
jgi:hypothetical protein